MANLRDAGHVLPSGLMVDAGIGVKIRNHHRGGGPVFGRSRADASGLYSTEEYSTRRSFVEGNLAGCVAISLDNIAAHAVGDLLGLLRRHRPGTYG